MLTQKDLIKMIQKQSKKGSGYVGFTNSTHSGGALSLAGGALKLAGQGENFKKLSKAEQKRVRASIIKMLYKKKQMGGLKIAGLDLSLLPSIGRAIKQGLVPQSALGKFIRSAIANLLKIRMPGTGKKTKNERGPSTNPWIIHIKSTMAKNPGMPLQTVIGIAKNTYKKGSGARVGAGKRKRKKK